MRIISGGLGVLALVVVPASSVAAQAIDREFHESFDVTEGMRLSLSHGDGDVVIEPWDRDVLDVQVRYRADEGVFGLGRADDFTVDFRRRGDTITVVGRERENRGFLFGNRTREYTYTIQAPAYLDLDLQGDDGDLEVRDWTGRLEIRLDDGDVTLTEVRTERITIGIEDGDVDARGIEGAVQLTSDDGNVRLSECAIVEGRFRLEDGDLEVDACEGDFDVELDDGRTDFRRLRTRRLDVRSEDGHVFVHLLGGAPDVNLQSDDGRIEVELDPDVSARFVIETDDGPIDVERGGVDVLDDGRRRVTGSVGDGQGRIRVRTADGRVVFGRARAD